MPIMTMLYGYSTAEYKKDPPRIQSIIRRAPLSEVFGWIMGGEIPDVSENNMINI